MLLEGMQHSVGERGLQCSSSMRGNARLGAGLLMAVCDYCSSRHGSPFTQMRGPVGQRGAKSTTKEKAKNRIDDNQGKKSIGGVRNK